LELSDIIGFSFFIPIQLKHIIPAGGLQAPPFSIDVLSQKIFLIAFEASETKITLKKIGGKPGRVLSLSRIQLCTNSHECPFKFIYSEQTLSGNSFFTCPTLFHSYDLFIVIVYILDSAFLGT
jgi:hypothetical protein